MVEEKEDQGSARDLSLNASGESSTVKAGDRVGFKGGYATVIAVADDRAWLRWDHLEDYCADTIFSDIERLYRLDPNHADFEPKPRPE